MDTTVKLQSLRYSDLRTYLFALLFVAGNVIVPQLAHLAHMGGPTWLPIYFFTLVGAYLYGWRVGLLTAIVSPIVNHIFFGMPGAAAMPAILLKSSILAVAAGYAATRAGGVKLLAFVAVVAAYQLLGTLGEWAMLGDLRVAAQDLLIGWPGMLVQIVGGYTIAKAVSNQ
ncbi:MAG: ECF transporter S component [Bacteroidales bacterium]|nr:ECF transporter S component [Bacteroidales bacterium]